MTAPVAPPQVFLFPGMHGDDPGIRSFADLCAPFARVTLQDHPHLEAPVSQLREMRVAGDVAADLVDRVQPHGALLLAGYSYGGCVAHEAAVTLVARGREVAALLLVDGVLPSTDVDLHGLATARVRRLDAVASGRIAAQRFMARSISFDEVRRGLARACDLLPGNHAHGARRRLVAFLRMEAIYDWKPRGLDVPSTLIVTGQYADAVIPGWSAMLPRLHVIRLPGRHVDVFQGLALDRLVTEVQGVLDRTTGPMT